MANIQKHKGDKEMKKKGIKKAIDLLKSCQRYDLEWEWMSKASKGEYVKFDDIYQLLIEAVRKETS
jgi:hypothetical protein